MVLLVLSSLTRVFLGASAQCSLFVLPSLRALRAPPSLWFDGSFLSGPTSAPASAWTAVCLPLLPKGVLVASGFGQFWIKLPQTSVCRLVFKHKFSTCLGK